MSSLARLAARPWLVASIVLGTLSGCSWFAAQPPPPAPPPLPPVPSYDLVAAIHAAGEREESEITVNGLVDPGVAALQRDAAREEQAGQFKQAAATLDQALKLNPDAPDLLQDRAEVAIKLKDFAQAEALARQSWSLGPKLGSLCARNWQTVVEMRLQARDAAGAVAARKAVAACHKPGVTRY
jgi:tetratricopeptide (TPR) repeat protein